jgi:hypothetical protein
MPAPIATMPVSAPKRRMSNPPEAERLVGLSGNVIMPERSSLRI